MPPVVRYLENQGPGLVAYVDDVVGALENLTVAVGSELVRELARLWRVEKELANAHVRWSRRKELEQLWLDASIRNGNSGDVMCGVPKKCV